MTDIQAPPFPLPAGHVFGPQALGDLRFHDGRNAFEGLKLLGWQQAYIGRWRRPQMQPPTGKYDGATKRWVVEVQQTLGIAPTGLLGPQEWAAGWEYQPPKKPEPEPKPKTIQDEPWVKKAKNKRKRLYWEKVSEWRVRYGSDPDAPEWYPGRPFGPHEFGSHVKRVQEMLGLRATGIMNRTTCTKIRGFQAVNDIPISGVVDARTASLLESSCLVGETGHIASAP